MQSIWHCKILNIASTRVAPNEYTPQTLSRLVELQPSDAKLQIPIIVVVVEQLYEFHVSTWTGNALR